MTIQPNAMQDLLSRNHFIDRTKAASMIGKFTTHRNRLFKTKKNYCTLPFNAPSLPNCITYNKDAILQLMGNSDCVAMRVYPAINDAGQLTFVLVGVDATGTNILSPVDEPNAINLRMAVTSYLDEGQQCPPYPAPSGGL